MKTIRLPTYGIVIKLSGDGGGGSILSADLDDPIFDGILSLILAHAVVLIDVESPAYLEGIETAVQGIGNDM
jgi:hypothetical protein